MTLLDRVRNVLGLAARHEQGRWWPAAVMTLLVLPAVWFASMAATSAEEDKTRAAAQPANAEKRADLLVLNIDGNGNLIAAEPIDDLDGFLAKQVKAILSANHMTPADLKAGREMPTTVMICADRGTPYEKLNQVIAACQKHGFHKVALQTRKAEPARNSKEPATLAIAPVKSTATAFFQIRMEENPAMNGGTAQVDRDRFDIYKNTQAELLKSRMVLRAALKSPEGAKWMRRWRASGDIEGYLSAALQVTFPNNSEIMKVSLRLGHSVDAVALLNVIVDTYMKEVVNAEQNRKQRRFDELDKISTEKEQEIRNKREELKGLAASAGGASPETRNTRQKLLLEELALCRQDIAKCESDLRRYRVDLAVQKAFLEDANGDVARVPILQEIKRLEISIKVTDGQRKDLAAKAAKVLEEAKRLGQDSVDIEMLQAKLRNLDQVLANFVTERERMGMEIRTAPRIMLLERPE